MLRSMTGFGSASGVVEGVEFSVEARSVNNRYFKAVLKLPEGFSELEPPIEKRLRSRIARGVVSLIVRVRLPDEQTVYRVNTPALNAYLEQLRELEVEANPTLRIDLGTLMQLPGVCEPPALDALFKRTHAGLLGLVDEALAGLTEMRRAEGDALAEVFREHLEAIAGHLRTVKQRGPKVVEEYHRRLGDRVAELTDAGRAQIDQDVLAREVALFAERSDVAEEVHRLGGHVEQFREALKSDAPAGRKLDFIAQEMLREANTIASKSNDSEIAQAVVEIKTGIDRIKEQAQNAE